MCLDTLLKYSEKTIGYLTGTCMALTFAIFAILIMQKNSVDLADSQTHKIQTGCGAEPITDENVFGNDERAKIMPWMAHRLRIMEPFKTQFEPNALPWVISNFVENLKHENSSIEEENYSWRPNIYDEMLKEHFSDGNLPFDDRPILQLQPSTSFITSKYEIVSSDFGYNVRNQKADYILTGDFLGRFHDLHWGNSSWYPFYEPFIFFDIPDWPEGDSINNTVISYNGNMTGHLFFKHAASEKPRYQKINFNGQLRKVENITKLVSMDPVKDVTKYQVLKLEEDLEFNPATQPLCIKPLSFYENLSTSLTQNSECYIQDNIQLTLPHPIKSIFRSKRDNQGNPLNIKFGEMMDGDDMLLMKLKPGYCYDFPESYNKRYRWGDDDITFEPLIVCKEGGGVTGGSAEWFVVGTATQNTDPLCYVNFPFKAIPETEARVQPIFSTDQMTEVSFGDN